MLHAHALSSSSLSTQGGNVILNMPYVKDICKKGYYLHVIDQYSSHFCPLDTPEPVFYSDEHCGGASAAGEGPVALPKGGWHLLSHAREIHLQSACQRRWSNPEVIQPGTHRHSFIIQQQQSSIWWAMQEPLYLFDFFKERVNILVLNAFDIQHEIKLALIHSNLA